MTQSPPIPRSRRNLNDLESLIDASIGKSDTYGAPSPSPEKPNPDAEASIPLQVKTCLTAAFEPPSGPLTVNALNIVAETAAAKSERFRISIDANVIMATKMLAVQQKKSPSEIVEQALRRYLNRQAD